MKVSICGGEVELCSSRLECAQVVDNSHPTPPALEWQKISSDSCRTVEEAELVEANVAYLGWLTDNLAAMEPARKEAVVSPTTYTGGVGRCAPSSPTSPLQVSLLLQQSIPAPTRDNLSVYVCSNFVLSHFIRVTEDHTLQLKVAAILSWNIHCSSSMLAEQSPSDVCIVSGVVWCGVVGVVWCGGCGVVWWV